VAGIAGVTGVVAAFGKAIGQAAERETGAQRFGAVVQFVYSVYAVHTVLSC
jgi:hypothetical protein